MSKAVPVAILAAVVVPHDKTFDQRHRTGPFDLIGDVHGCLTELERLLERLEYEFEDDVWCHPEGRTAIFLGDVVDRGPQVPEVIVEVSEMVRQGSGLYVPGNHDERFAAFLAGEDLQLAYGLEQTVDQLADLDGSARADALERFWEMYNQAPPYLWLDDGRLVAVHGGLEEPMIGSFDAQIWQFCLMGKIAMEASFGIRRVEWAGDYGGEALVAYGHTPCARAAFLNNTINLDQGCVFGGALSALCYPERSVVTLRAARPYFIPGRATA